MKLLSTADSIDKIANLGSTELPSRKLYLYQKCNCKIIEIQRPTSGNNGKLILQGDADSTVDGLLTDADVIWLTTRPCNSTHDVTLAVQPSYSSTNKVTTITIPTNANFKVDSLDIGGYVCKRIDVTSKIVDKSIGDISYKLEDGFANSGSTEFSVSLDNDSYYFYNREDKNGLFFSTPKYTKVTAVASTSTYSTLYRLYTTQVTVEAINTDKVGADYVGHYMLFNSGKAVGHQALITDYISGTIFEVIGYFSDNYYNPVEYQTEIAINDSVHLNITSEYYFRFEFGLMSEITDRKNLICGKLDLSTITFDKFDTVVSIKGYTSERDLDNKVLGNIPFTSSGIKCTNIKEMNCVYYEPSTGSLLQSGVSKIERKLSDEEASFLNVVFAAYDVEPGWHFIDVIPNLGLYRFGYGDWYRVRSSLDFEYSTQTVFLPNENGEIPDHSSKDGADETKAHNGWAQVEFETKDSSSAGISGQTYQGMDAGLALNPEKITGLPNKPMRLFFKLHNGVALNKKQDFIGRIGYEFDGGGIVYPEIYPAIVLEGAALGSMANASYLHDTNWGTTNNVLMIGGFDKFDGLYLNVVFQASGGIVTKLLQHLKFSYSIGGDYDTAASWSGNVYPRYCGAISKEVTGVYSQTVIRMAIYNWDRPGGGGTGGGSALSADELNNMYLKSVSGDNFGETRKIDDFALAADDYGEITIASAFDNNVTVDDQFEVVNKDAIVKIKDFGDSLHNGGYFDCILMTSVNVGESGATLNTDKRSDFYENHLSSDASGVMEYLSYIFLGKSEKFNCINAIFENNSSKLFVPMHIEYYDGNGWKPVENLSVWSVDTTNSAYIGSGDDNLHYLISFECNGWVKKINLSDEDIVNDSVNLFYIRIKTLMNYARSVVRIEPVIPSNLNAVIIWNNLKNWSKNVYTDENCYDMGTLNKIIQDVEYYFVRLDLDGSWKTLNKICTINRLYGHNSDSLYAYFDMLNLKDIEDADYIAYNKNMITNCNVVPRISTDKYIIDNIGSAADIGKRLLITKNYLKNKIDLKNKHLNLIGDFSGSTKIIPAKYNWDSAQYFYSNASSEDSVAEDILCTCVIKDRGKFILFLLKNTGDGTIYKYESTTGEPGSWGAAHATTIIKTTDSFTLDAIKWISVTKNRQNATYYMYLVGTQGGEDEIYRITWDTWGTFTADNTPVIVLGGVGDYDESAIIDCCVIWNGNDYWEIWYTGYDSGGDYHIMWASSADGDAFSKQTSLDLSTILTPGIVRCPAVVTSSVSSTDTDALRLVYFITHNDDGDDVLYLARVGENGFISANATLYSTAILYKSINYCYEGDGAYMVPFSYDHIRFYYSTSTMLCILMTVDMVSYTTVRCSKEYKEEFGEFDKFASDQTSLTFDDNDQVLLLGFREKFNTVDLKEVTASDEYLLVQYWNGTDWADLKVYQYGKYSEQVKNKMGFYFDEPNDWQPIDMGYLIDNQKISGAYEYQKRITSSLYWIKLSGDGNASPIYLNSAKLIKGAYIISDKNDVWVLKNDGFLEHKLCATRLFASSIYRKEIADISYDESNGNIIVTTDTSVYNPYAMNYVVSFVNGSRLYVMNIFDKTNKIADIGYVQHLKNTKYVYRIGSDITNDNSKKVNIVGRWTDGHIDSFVNP